MNANFLYKKALQKWGKKAILVQTMEECSELQQSCSKLYKGARSNASEEIVDVEIMIENLKVMLNFPKSLKRWREIKLKRLERRLK